MCRRWTLVWFSSVFWSLCCIWHVSCQHICFPFSKMQITNLLIKVLIASLVKTKSIPTNLLPLLDILCLSFYLHSVLMSARPWCSIRFHRTFFFVCLSWDADKIFSTTHHNLHGRPPRCPPVHSHPLVDHMSHCSHYLCRDKILKSRYIVNNWTDDGATISTFT